MGSKRGRRYSATETVECDGNPESVDVEDEMMVVGLGSIDGPDQALVDQGLTFQIKTDPEGYEDDVNWSLDGSSAGSGMELTTSFSEKGEKQLGAVLRPEEIEGDPKQHSVVLRELTSEITPAVVPVETSLTLTYKVMDEGDVLSEEEFSHPGFSSPGENQVSTVVGVPIEGSEIELEINETVTAVDISEPVVTGPTDIFTGEDVSVQVASQPGGYEDMIHWDVQPGGPSGTGKEATVTIEEEGTHTFFSGWKGSQITRVQRKPRRSRRLTSFVWT